MLVTFQLLGDVSLDGLYCDPQNHAAFAKNCFAVGRLLGTCDFRIANWESPLYGSGEVNVVKRIRLATTRAAAASVLPLGIDIATLANNHTFDCGKSGFLETRAFLEANGIRSLGAGLTAAEARQPLLLKRQGITFALLNYVGPETCPMLPESGDEHLNILEEERVAEDVSLWAQRVDHVLVALHWGDRDVMEHPLPTMRALGRRLVEAGARLVFGGQIHALLGWEKWQDGAILYSLGNYCFSPFGMSDGEEYREPHPLTQEGAVASVDFDKRSLVDVRWLYLRQPGRSLLLEKDLRPCRRSRHEKQSAALKLTDKDFARTYRWNVRKWAVREYVARHGGLWRAALGLRTEELGWLFRRAGIVLRRWMQRESV